MDKFNLTAIVITHFQVSRSHNPLFDNVVFTLFYLQSYLLNSTSMRIFLSFSRSIIICHLFWFSTILNSVKQLWVIFSFWKYSKGVRNFFCSCRVNIYQNHQVVKTNAIVFCSIIKGRKKCHLKTLRKLHFRVFIL